MKTIKVIDILNKIAKGEEVPKFIKVYDEFYEYEGFNKVYRNSNDKQLLDIYNGRILNYEAEIFEVKPIEDTPKEDKKIEKLNLDTDKLRGKETPRAIDYLLESKINEIIDKINGE